MVKKVVSLSCVVELPLVARGIPNETLEQLARSLAAAKLPISIPLMGLPGASIQINAESLYLGITDPAERTMVRGDRANRGRE
jgi:hypothetical protein